MFTEYTVCWGLGKMRDVRLYYSSQKNILTRSAMLPSSNLYLVFSFTKGILPKATVNQHKHPKKVKIL
jgi:hypothetical protein